jgi:CubicO group peptidase (beta-lactamase class C family)
MTIKLKLNTVHMNLSCLEVYICASLRQQPKQITMMSLSKCAVLSLLIAAFCCNIPVSAQYDVLDLYMTRTVQLKKFTGTVLMAEGDEIIYRKAFGPANEKGNELNDVESVYRIGSITKSFTSVLIMQLAEQGKIKLDDKLSIYYRNFPRSEEVTIRQLLSHTSGIPEYTTLPDFAEWKYDKISPLDLVDKLKHVPFTFEPGERFGYSNTNYIFLGIILEEIYKKPYELIVLNQICEPAGMTKTGSNLDKRNLNLSEGLTPTRDGYKSEKPVNASVPFAAGTLYSTTDDMLIFSRKLHSGYFFAEKATLTEMTTPVNDMYALGIYKSTMAGLEGIGHNGGIDGYAAQWLYFPEKDLTLITLSNNMTADHAAVGEAMVKTFLREPIEIPAERKLIVLPEATLQKYVGSYELAPNFLIEITIDNGGLKAQATGQSAFDLYAQSETEFYAIVAVLEITFHADEESPAKALTLEQGGQKTYAKRFEIKDLSIQIPEAKLQRLVGTYELQPGFNLEIKLEAGKLMGQATGQPPFELYGESDTRFFATVAPIDLEFEIGDDGKAEALNLSQGGNIMRALKL